MSAVLSSDLQGAVALVTGAGGGIGRATCEAFAKAGARVVGTDLGDAPGDLKVDCWLRHDVASPEDWARVIGEIRNRFGQLDCLVNNAGLSLVERLEDTSLQQWRRLFSVNVESILLGMQAALPLLKESGAKRSGGSSVVNISSTAGIRGVPFNGAYSTSKGAVTLLTKSAAKEFATLKYPVRVNSVHPGVVDTAMIDSIMARYVEVGYSPSIEAAKAAFISRIPLGRTSKPQEIAGSIVFLCSPAASSMTGAEVVIDGGGTA